MFANEISGRLAALESPTIVWTQTIKPWLQVFFPLPSLVMVISHIAVIVIPHPGYKSFCSSHASYTALTMCCGMFSSTLLWARHPDCVAFNFCSHLLCVQSIDQFEMLGFCWCIANCRDFSVNVDEVVIEGYEWHNYFLCGWKVLESCNYFEICFIDYFSILSVLIHI